MYGESAQHRLMNGHVLVLGDNSLTDEVVKNLALAGVGKISLMKTERNLENSTSLLGQNGSIYSYVKGLNPQIEVM